MRESINYMFILKLGLVGICSCFTFCLTLCFELQVTVMEAGMQRDQGIVSLPIWSIICRHIIPITAQLEISTTQNTPKVFGILRERHCPGLTITEI